MGKRPTPCVRFYIRTKGYPTLRVQISYNYRQYSGTLDFWLPNAEFKTYLHSDGSLKDPLNSYRPQTFEKIDASDLLIHLRSIIENHLNERIEAGKEVNDEYIKKLLLHATTTHRENVDRWIGVLTGRIKLPEGEGKEGAQYTRVINKVWRNYFNPLEGWHEPEEQEGGAI